MFFIVSLDSISLPYLERMLDAGRVPVLAALLAKAKRLPMASARLAGVPYISMYTGLSPAEHGNYFPYQWSPEHQRVRGWHHLPRPRTIFERIDDAGGRCLLIDPPEMRAITLKHGFAISGWQFQGRVILHDWASEPSVARDLARRFGAPRRGDEVFGQPTVEALLGLRQVLLAAPLRLDQAVDHLLKSGMPDLFWITFPALHIAGHQFFDLGLLDGQPVSAEDRRLLSTTLDELLVAYDRTLGKALERLAPGAEVLVFYSKGMGPVTGYVDLLPEMLRRVIGGKAEFNPVTNARSILPRKWRTFAAELLPDHMAVELTARMWSPRTDWSRTRAFALPSDSPGFIQVNRAGRERWGIVPPSDVPALLAEVEEGLRTFTDWDGEPCIQSIAQPQALFGPGPLIGNYPDRVVYWAGKPTNGATGVRSPRYGDVVRQGIGLGRAGAHCDGVLGALMPGGSRFVATERVEAEDIAATLLSALGLPHDELVGRPFLTT